MCAKRMTKLRPDAADCWNAHDSLACCSFPSCFPASSSRSRLPAAQRPLWWRSTRRGSGRQACRCRTGLARVQALRFQLRSNRCCRSMSNCVRLRPESAAGKAEFANTYVPTSPYDNDALNRFNMEQDGTASMTADAIRRLDEEPSGIRVATKVEPVGRRRYRRWPRGRQTQSLPATAAPRTLLRPPADVSMKRDAVTC